jgi:hypothetical protein
MAVCTLILFVISEGGRFLMFVLLFLDLKRRDILLACSMYRIFCISVVISTCLRCSFVCSTSLISV